jgi:hypothetical protein
VWAEDFARDPNEWIRLEQFEEKFLPESWRKAPASVWQIGHGGSEYFLVLDFIDAVQGRKPPAIDIHAALDMTLPGLVSQESIRQHGKWLPVPDSRAW